MTRHHESDSRHDPGRQLHGGEPRISLLSPGRLQAAMERRRSTHPELAAEAERLHSSLLDRDAVVGGVTIMHFEGTVTAHIRYATPEGMFYLTLEAPAVVRAAGC